MAAVKAPGFGDSRKDMLHDLAVLTRTTVVVEETGGKLEDMTLAQLGSAKTVSLSKDDTVFLDGSGDKSAIEERCELIRSSIELTGSEAVTRSATVIYSGGRGWVCAGVGPGGASLLSETTSCFATRWTAGGLAVDSPRHCDLFRLGPSLYSCGTWWIQGPLAVCVFVGPPEV